MTNNVLRHLPPPPLFTISSPPKPPGLSFEHFQIAEILNGQCTRPSLNILNISSTNPEKNQEQMNWSNFLLLIFVIISIVSCTTILIFIFICLK